MRREYFLGSGITDSKSRDHWEAEGGKDTRHRARELARSILKKKKVSYIPEVFDRRIRQKFEILL
jgi:trimethylamine:corrinoid methyltransferase-like protein